MQQFEHIYTSPIGRIKIVADKYGENVAAKVSILYGGSVKPSNAQEIFSKPDVDGGLIGGAALNIEDFKAIIDAI